MAGSGADGAHLITRFIDCLDGAQRAAVAAVCDEAEARGATPFLVGGAVRDLLFDQTYVLTAAPAPLLDIDIVMETDATAVATAATTRLGLRPPRVHPAFGTATLYVEGLPLDVVTARREVYPHPGALPVVTPARIDDDLARRDVTINAMALALRGPEMGALLDPLGGRADLAAGILRVLHERSFQDDATRLLRVARYAARFDFRPEPTTQALIERDAAYLESISPARVRHEFERIAAEVHPEQALAQLADWGVAQHGLGLPLQVDVELRAAYGRAAELDAEPSVKLLLPAARWDAAAIERLVERLALTREEARAARDFPRLQALTAAPETPPSLLVETLDQISPLALRVWALLDEADPAVAAVRRYIREWRQVRSQVGAEGLRRMGLPVGPAIGRILKRLRLARIDDPALTLDAERLLAEHMIQDEVEGHDGVRGAGG